MAKRLNGKRLLLMVSLSVLVGVEILGASAAAGWATGGLFQLGKEVTWGLIALSAAFGLWATIKFVKGALKVEPIYK